MEDNKVTVQLLYFFALLMSLLCLGLSILNISEIMNIQQGKPDIYLFLPKKQGIIYSTTCGIVFTILFAILCYGFLKNKKRWCSGQH